MDVLNLFSEVGVVAGRGKDGELMARIIQEVALEPDAPVANPVYSALQNFNPGAKVQCPLCKAPDFNECGCPADEQMAAMM